MKQHIRETLRYLNFETNIAGAFVSMIDSAFVFVGWGHDDEKSIMLKFSPGGRLDSHCIIHTRDESENNIEILENDDNFTWIDFD